MAERRENPRGRLLFTDLDASDKGRPAAILTDNGVDDDPVDYLNAPIPTIEDLASTLGLDFEDDFSSEEEAPPEDAGAALPFADEEDYIPDRPAPTGIPAATTADPDTVFGARPRGRPEAEPPFSRSRTTRISPFREPEAFPQSPRDPAAEEPDPGDEEIDILSMLEAPEADDDFGRESWRGQRLGVAPPRPVPYAGIKRLDEWYRPPENPVEEDGEQAPPRIDDWYEPPRNLPADAGDAGDDRSGTRGSDTSGLDLFSNIDLDAVWKDRVDEFHNQPARRSGDSTGNVDMFADLDLDTLWDEKRRQAAAPEDAGPAPDAPPRAGGHADDAASTMVLPAGAFDNQATVILPPDARLEAADPAARAPSRRRKKSSGDLKKPKKSPSGPKRKTTEEDALAFLDDLSEAFSESAGEDGGAPREPAKGSRRSKTGLPTTLEELEIEDLISDADERKDDAWRTASTDDEDTEILDNFEDLSDRGPATTDDFLDGLDLDSLVDADGGDVAAPVLDDSAIAPMGPNGDNDDEAGSSAYDDALDDLSLLDDPSVNADVKPPVIDDSAIASTRPRGRDDDADDETGAAPPEARRRQSAAPAPDGGDADPEPGDGGEADEGETAVAGEEGGEEEAPVAVNPMDVFANMDDMDFSDDDGLDDEMKAALMDDDEPGEDEEGGANPDAASPEAPPPPGLRGKAVYYAKKGLFRVMPRGMIDRLSGMIAWRENWWFYCDIAAAIIASASLAVIISYFLWYRQ